MNYVSAHARVFEGVRTARIRAYDESLIPPDMRREQCLFHDEAADCLWVHADTGNISPLCVEHLRTSLKTFHGEVDSAPPAVIPIRRRTA